MGKLTVEVPIEHLNTIHEFFNIYFAIHTNSGGLVEDMPKDLLEAIETIKHSLTKTGGGEL